MKLTVDFPAGDEGKLSEILDILVPVEKIDSVLTQLEDPNSWSTCDDDPHTKLNLVAAILNKADNHTHHCGALRSRREDFCDCVLGKLRAALKPNQN